MTSVGGPSTKPLGKGRVPKDRIVFQNGIVASLEYNRININGVRFSTNEYHKNFKFENDFLQFKSGKFGVLHRIFETEYKNYFLECKILHTEVFCLDSFLVKHLHEILGVNHSILININEVDKQCIHIKTEHADFLSLAPNKIELD